MIRTDLADDTTKFLLKLRDEGKIYNGFFLRNSKNDLIKFLSHEIIMGFHVALNDISENCLYNIDITPSNRNTSCIVETSDNELIDYTKYGNAFIAFEKAINTYIEWYVVDFLKNQEGGPTTIPVAIIDVKEMVTRTAISVYNDMCDAYESI